MFVGKWVGSSWMSKCSICGHLSSTVSEEKEHEKYHGDDSYPQTKEERECSDFNFENEHGIQKGVK